MEEDMPSPMPLIVPFMPDGTKYHTDSRYI